MLLLIPVGCNTGVTGNTPFLWVLGGYIEIKKHKLIDLSICLNEKCVWSTRPPIIGCGWQETNAGNGVVFSIWGRSYGAFLQSKLRVYLWENPLVLLLVKGSCSWWIMIIQHLKNRSNMIIFFSHLCSFQASISKSINLFIPNQLASLNLRCIAPKLPWHGLVECWWADWSVPLAHLVVTDLSDPPNPRREADHLLMKIGVNTTMGWFHIPWSEPICCRISGMSLRMV
jgi:hypothetical protein